jgi:hypothetical protein
LPWGLRATLSKARAAGNPKPEIQNPKKTPNQSIPSDFERRISDFHFAHSAKIARSLYFDAFSGMNADQQRSALSDGAPKLHMR